MSLLFLHDRLSFSASLFTFAMGIGAVWLAWRGRGIDGGYLGAVLVGEALLVAQAIVGALLWLRADAGPDRGIHILYGTMAVLLWPFALTFTRRGGTRRDSVLMAATSLFLWGIVVRAIDTAGAG